MIYKNCTVLVVLRRRCGSLHPESLMSRTYAAIAFSSSPESAVSCFPPFSTSPSVANASCCTASIVVSAPSNPSSCSKEIQLGGRSYIGSPLHHILRRDRGVGTSTKHLDSIKVESEEAKSNSHVLYLCPNAGCLHAHRSKTQSLW